MNEALSFIMPWILVCTSYIYVYYNRSFRKNPRLFYITIFALSLHHAVAIGNGFFGPLPGGDTDALVFQQLAKEWVHSGTWTFALGSRFYVQFLGTLYRFTGTSFFAGCEISVLFFIFSCWLLVKIMELLSIPQNAMWLVILFFGCLPPVLVFTSVPLRDIHELFFLLSAVYCGLRFHLYKHNIMAILCICSAGLMGIFHTGLFVYSAFAILLLLTAHISTQTIRIKNLSLTKTQCLGISLVTFAIIAGIFWFALVGGDYRQQYINISSTGIGNFLNSYHETARSANIESRANYYVAIDENNRLSVFTGLIQLYAHYMFGPFPPEVTSFKDIYAVIETVCRVVLLVSIFSTWFTRDMLNRSLYRVLMILYFTMTMLWATGTMNYGTAIRHHIITNWILYVLGLPILVKYTNIYKCASNNTLINVSAT